MSLIYDTIIVGAGISGLTLATRLKSQGKRILVLEKSAGVGGRIATRRMDNCTFDHGAQFIKQHRSDPRSPLDTFDFQEKGRIWFSTSDEDYLVFPKGMTQFPKSISSALDIRLNEKVMYLRTEDSFCRLETETGEDYRAQQIYLTCPLPQSLAILRSSGLAYPLELESITYAPALVGLFQLQSDNADVLGMTYCQDVSANIFSISNQLSKGVSQILAYTAIMQPAWSEKYFDREDAINLSELTSLFTSTMEKMNGKNSFEIVKSQLKKWRYSHPLQIFPTPFVNLNNDHKIFLLGDAFGGGSIVGAIRSANSLPISE